MAIQARTEFAAAINQIASEKGVDASVIIDAIEQAAIAAYRKDLSYRNEAIPDDFEELTSKIDPSSGEIAIFRGDVNITPPGFARIAAQTAKQVIAQKLHEAEKGAIFEEYDQKIGTIVSGSIQRQEGNTYFVDLGRAEGLMPPQEQTRDEFYSAGSRMKFLIKEIRESGRGPEVIVSRTDPGLVKGLFAMEVPEIQSGAVEIKEVAREAGGRTKVAVVSSQDGVDPVGSLVGQKGVRVQAVINELGDEKIDIVGYSEDPARFIAAALSPAKDITVHLREEEKVAKVIVPDHELSLAIGKGGQNVRLAAKLTGWKIDIEGTGDSEEAKAAKAEEESKSQGVKESDSEDGGQKTDDGKTEEAGTHEDEVQVDAAQSDDAFDSGAQAESSGESEEVKKIEENIDEAVVEESADGKTQPEPSDEDQSEAVADAEVDIEADPEMNAGESEVGESEKSDQADEIQTAPEGDFNEVEEERNAKMKEAAKDEKSDE